jgi:hypothetical protein
MQKTHKFYRSKWVGFFTVLVIAGSLTFSVILIVYKTYLTGGLIAAAMLISIPWWKDEFNFKREIVVVTEDTLFINTKRVIKKFDLAEVSHVEFTSGPSIFEETVYLFIHYYVVKEPEKIFLPDLNVSQDDLAWLINTLAKNHYKLYKG